MPSNGEYTSLVPKYRFSETLEQQESELASNPLLSRMLAARKQYSDPHRPIYHYVNPEGMLNDPNGLCFWQGRWHLFYQGYPPEDPRQHWGHAVSDDLVHWRDLPYAIYPDPEECCYSGATLVEEDRVIAIYHGTKVGNMVATSRDPLLLNWEKVAGRAVIPIGNPDEKSQQYRVFDPCIWKEGDCYYSLSGGTLPVTGDVRRRRANFLFRSSDLEHWEYLHPFVEDDQYTLFGDDGACPYFWPIGKKHMLLFFSHMSGGQYIIGEYDTERDKLVATDHGRFNFGAAHPSGVHAPSASPDGDGGIVVIFNMNPGRATKDWNQIMSLPRRLTVGGSDELRIEPVRTVESLRGTHRRLESRTIPANSEMIFDGIEGNSIELAAVIDTKESPVIEIDVLRSPDGEERTRILFFRDRGFRNRAKKNTTRESVITIDSSRSSSLPDVLIRPPESAKLRLDAEEKLELRIFVDRSVVEVFANGRQCVAVRAYPGRSDSTGVSIRSQGRDIELLSLDMWEMENIYS